MNTVLVTGASGFIGSHAAECFAREGWRVFALVHRTLSPRLRRLIGAGQVLPVMGNLGDAASARAVLDDCRKQAGAPLDAIAHCAGRASDSGWAGTFRRANYDPVRFLGEAAAAGGARRLVFVSTTDVYGLLDHDQAEEDCTPLRAVPRNPYPRYKILAEAWLRQNVPAGCWSIVRPAAVWGPDDPTLTPRILRFLRGSPLIVHFGPWGGGNRWPLAHVDNVAQAIFLAATLPEAAGQAVNVLDAEHTTVDEFYRLLAAACLPGRAWRTWRLPFWIGLMISAPVSAISWLLNLSRPFADPSLYALYSISRNLDFSNDRWRQWMARAGRRPVSREDGLRQLRECRDPAP